MNPWEQFPIVQPASTGGGDWDQFPLASTSTTAPKPVAPPVPPPPAPKPIQPYFDADNRMIEGPDADLARDAEIQQRTAEIANSGQQFSSPPELLARQLFERDQEARRQFLRQREEKIARSGLTPEQFAQQEEVEHYSEVLPGFEYMPIRAFWTTILGAGKSWAALGARATGQGELADDIIREGSRLEGAAQTADESGVLNPRLARGIRGASQSLFRSGVTAVAGGLPAIIAEASAASANEAITEGRDAGLSGTKLAAYAATIGGIEGATTALFSKIGLGGVESRLAAKALTGQTFKAAAKQLGKDSVGELTEEQTIFIGQSVAKYLSSVDPNALDTQRLADGMLDVAIQTAIASGAVNTPNLARSVGVQEPSQPTADSPSPEPPAEPTPPPSPPTPPQEPPPAEAFPQAPPPQPPPYVVPRVDPTAPGAGADWARNPQHRQAAEKLASTQGAVTRTMLSDALGIPRNELKTTPEQRAAFRDEVRAAMEEPTSSPRRVDLAADTKPGDFVMVQGREVGRVIGPSDPGYMQVQTTQGVEHIPVGEIAPYRQGPRPQQQPAESVVEPEPEQPIIPEQPQNITQSQENITETPEAITEPAAPTLPPEFASATDEELTKFLANMGVKKKGKKRTREQLEQEVADLIFAKTPQPAQKIGPAPSIETPPPLPPELPKPKKTGRKSVDAVPAAMRAKTGKTFEVQPETDLERQQVAAGKAIGINVRIVDTDSADGLTVRGWMEFSDPKTVWVGRNGVAQYGEDIHRAVTAVFAHEVHHTLRRSHPELWSRLADVIQRTDAQGLADAERLYMESAKDWVPEQHAMLEKDAELRREEAVSSYLENVLADKGFIERLARTDKNLFEKIADFIRSLVGKLKGNPILEEVQAVWDQVRAEVKQQADQPFELARQPARVEPAIQVENIRAKQMNLPEVRGRGDLAGQTDFIDQLQPAEGKETPKQVLERRIRDEVGEDPDNIETMRQVVDEVWSTKKNANADLLASYDQVFSGRRSLAQSIRMRRVKGQDAAKIPGFDQLVEEVVSYHPHLLRWDEASAATGDAESAVLALIEGGRRQFETPPKHSDEIIREAKEFFDRAASFDPDGPGFGEYALRPPPRPDLANPATAPEARATVDDADAERSARGEPKSRPDADVIAEAESRLKKDFAGERARLLKTGREGGTLGDTDTIVAKEIINREGVDAVQSGDKQKIRDAIDLIDAYRRTGTEQARGFRQRRDPVETPAQRRARAITEAILTPPTRDKREIDKARRDGDNQKAENLRNKWAEEVEKLRETIKAMGVDPNNIRAYTKDPVVSAQVLGTIQAAKADRWDAAYEYWRNAILSGPATQVTNIVGNTLHTGWHYTAERLTEALVNTAVRDKGAAQLGEFRYLLAGVLPGLSKGAQNFLRAWKAEIPYFEAELGRHGHTKLEEPNIAIRGNKGRIIRMPQRLLLAADEMSKTLIANMEVGARAYRIAKSEGLKGQQMANRIALLTADTTSIAWDQALDTALELTFQSDPGKLATALLRGRRDVPGLRYLVPFITTPANIFRLGLKKSPLGSLKLPFTVYRAAQSGDWSKVSAEGAQQVLAWGVVLALLGNAPEDPWITGAAVETKRGPRELSYRTAPPQSIRIGGMWYSYSRIEPFATVLASTVDMIQAMQQGEEGKGETLFRSITGQVQNKTFLAGIGDFLEALQAESPNKVADWASNFAVSWVPNLARTAGRSAGEAIPERGVWGPSPERTARLLRRTLQKTELGIVPDQPKIDVWGRAIPRDKSPVPKTDWLWRMVSPVKARDAKAFIGDRLLVAWNNAHPGDEKYPLPPRPDYKHGGKKHAMTDEQYTQFLKVSGSIARKLVETEPLDAINPTQTDLDALSSALTEARTMAKEMLVAEWTGGPKASTSMDTIAAALHRKRVYRLRSTLRRGRPKRKSGETVDSYSQRFTDWANARTSAAEMLTKYRGQ